MTKAETQKLLDKLCAECGFCLPPEEERRIVDNPPTDARAFTDAVFVAEGLGPEPADRDLYRQVRGIVTEAFRRSELRETIAEELGEFDHKENGSQ